MSRTIVAIAVISTSLAARASNPPTTRDTASCVGVMDVTDGCGPVASEGPGLVDDKPPGASVEPAMAATRPTWTGEAAPGSVLGAITLVGLGVAAAGTAALAVGLATVDAPHVADTARIVGTTLLLGAGLAGAGAVALWVFDPSTGQPGNGSPLERG